MNPRVLNPRQRLSEPEHSAIALDLHGTKRPALEGA